MLRNFNLTLLFCLFNFVDVQYSDVEMITKEATILDKANYELYSSILPEDKLKFLTDKQRKEYYAKINKLQNKVDNYQKISCSIGSRENYVDMSDEEMIEYCKSMKILLIFDDERRTFIPDYYTGLTMLSFRNTLISTIPNTFVNLKTIICDGSILKDIPKELVNIQILSINNTRVNVIPDTLINLKMLYCNNSPIIAIPNTLINLKTLHCCNTSIVEIPKEFKNLIELKCNRNVIVPKNIKNQINKYNKISFIDRMLNKSDLKKLTWSID